MAHHLFETFFDVMSVTGNRICKEDTLTVECDICRPVRNENFHRDQEENILTSYWSTRFHVLILLFFRLHFKVQLDGQDDVRSLTFLVALPQCHEDSLSRVLREAHPILTYCLSEERTDTPLKRNPFRKAGSPLPGQEITCVFCSPKVHYHAFKWLSLDYIPSQLNAVHTISSQQLNSQCYPVMYA